MNLRSKETKKMVVAPHMVELFMHNLARKVLFKYHVRLTIFKVAKLKDEDNYGIVCKADRCIRDLTVVELLYAVCQDVKVRFSVVDAPDYNAQGQMVLRLEQ